MLRARLLLLLLRLLRLLLCLRLRLALLVVVAVVVVETCLTGKQVAGEPERDQTNALPKPASTLR